MKRSRRVGEVALVLAGLMMVAGAVSAQSAASGDGTDGSAAQQSQGPASTPTPTPTPAPTSTPAAKQGPAQSAAVNQTDARADARIVHHLAADVSVALGPNWQEYDIGSMPPPAGIAKFAPPFHLTGILALQ